MDINKEQNSSYLSPLGFWALSFGCSVGWGAFVMPGTTFLPMAGPVGTLVGIITGAIVMLVIGMNYFFLMNRCKRSGGTLSYTTEAFGYDHGFLSAWFLVLVYVAIIWANASALVLIGRNLLGDTFQFGFHYTILGYDVYLGETLITMAAIVIFGLLCIRSRALTGHIQAVLALILFAGIVAVFVMVKLSDRSVPVSAAPLFADSEKSPIIQAVGILALTPWAFVGFESVSHSVEEIRFPVKRSMLLMALAIAAGAASYIMLTLVGAAIQPEGYAGWTGYIAELSKAEGLASMPVFYAAYSAMGGKGPVVLGITLLAAITTGLIGNYIAASRLLCAMASEGMLPDWFSEKNNNGSPGNALRFLMIVSLFIPFLGRTAIGWIVDVTTVGATIAYGYTSADAIVFADRENNRPIKICGIVGLIFSLLFFLYFMVFSAGALSTESYLILAIWAILGFVYFRYVCQKDEKRRFGRSMIVWIGLLFLIFLTSLLWIHQATNDMTREVVGDISAYYEERNPNNDPESVADTENYLRLQLEKAGRQLTVNSIIQMAIIVATLGIMLSLYSMIAGRERRAEVEKAKAEESSRSKTIFLSNMSHDIRTPMNAIIGYIGLAEDEENDEDKLREYLGKIKTSSQHLLALINDVLEMSRIESGKMDLEPIPVDLKKTLLEVRDMFSAQMEEKHIDFMLDASQLHDTRVMCDKNRLNRVLLNLLSNAYKFTPEGGTVSVSAWQIGDGSDGYGHYELRVSDSGIGMTAEFAEKVFEAFERERTSTVSGIQGTGLGMAITKSIIDMMGGTIEVNTAPDRGTEFIIKLTFELDMNAPKEDDKKAAQEGKDDGGDEIDFSQKRLLLVEDMKVNREIALRLLKKQGFEVETAENGQIALEMVEGSAPGYYDAVLMDIQMPVMDGYDATRAIRALDDETLSAIPIIAMTANAFYEDIKKATDAGMNAHIAKPIDVGVMIRTLKDVLS